jgi:glutaredoxin-like YruB-family protein
MEVLHIDSHKALLKELESAENVYLLIYKSSSEQSDCAYKNLSATELDSKDIKVVSADVNHVRDIHEKYGVSSVPTLLEFKSGTLKNIVKGCHEEGFYKSYFENIIYELKVASDDKPAKRVTVYTTPTCPWCTTVKNYLRKNGIRYTEVDVASDQNAAKDMVSKSGQQGVPQTEINGDMVIGFDQSKLNRLLEIKSN